MLDCFGTESLNRFFNTDKRLKCVTTITSYTNTINYLARTSWNRKAKRRKVIISLRFFFCVIALFYFYRINLNGNIIGQVVISKSYFFAFFLLIYHANKGVRNPRKSMSSSTIPIIYSLHYSFSFESIKVPYIRIKFYNSLVRCEWCIRTKM